MGEASWMGSEDNCRAILFALAAMAQELCYCKEWEP